MNKKRKVTLDFEAEVIPKQSVRARAVTYKDKNTGECKAFIQTYQTKKIRDFEDFVRLQARVQLPRNFKPLTGPLEVSVRICFQKIKSISKKTSDAIDMGAIVYKSTKPDLTDNLLKGIFDALQGVAYYQDSQIAVLRNVEKIYGNTAYFTVTIEEIAEMIEPLFK